MKNKKARSEHSLHKKGIIPKSAIVEFKQIYLNEYGIELTDTDAVEEATKVINLVQLLILKPVVPEQEKL